MDLRDTLGQLGPWIWVIGGIEFCIFWSLCCLVVAMHAYRNGSPFPFF